MASTNYINECKNDAYKNRLGKIEIAEKKVTTGTSIKIEKGADSAIDLTLYGKSTQATRSGYNLVKNGNKFKGACSCAAGITGSLTNEGYQQFDVETGNSNWTTNWFYSINQEIEENLSEGDTFTIMFTMRRTEGMSIPPKIYIKNGMGYYSMIGTLSTEFSVVYYTGTWKDTNGIAPHLGFGGLTGTFIIKNWMIKKGGLEEWEDYGVMPSPDFPSPIESITEISVEVSGINSQSNSLTINLQGNELCSLPNGTKDELVVENGIAKIIKRIGKVVLDGSEAWYQAGTQLPNTFTTYTFLNDMVDNYVSTDLLFMSDKFKGVSNSGNYTSNDSNIITQNSSNQFKIMIIRIEKSLLSSVDVEGFKTWLSNNNVEVLYELAEPETINLGTVEMLHTYEGVSNITNSADTEMTVKAYEWTDEITNYDNLQSIQIDSGCYTDGNIIGSVYVECLNASFVAEATNLVDKIIRCQIGVKYADLSTEYICKGKYIIERPNNEITAQMSQITAYSDLYTNLEAIYICNLDYLAGNITLKDVYIDVCKQLGLTPLKTDFLNSTIPIKDNPFKNNEKNRVVLQTISKIACSFVNVYEDNNQIDLCWLSENAEPDYTFEMSDYVSVEGGQVICGPINCLIIKNSQIDDENVTIKDDESIKANGEHSITISDDYILHNAELRQQAITSIWNRVKGLKYVDCKLITYYGKPFLKLGNKIRVYTSDTDYFDTYVLKHKFEYDGAFASTIESPALTEQEIKTKQDISLGKALTNVQIDLDKQKERITSTVTTTNALQDSVSNLSETVQEQANQMQTLSTTLTQTNQSLQAEVNQINESLENGVSNLKNKLVTIDINGIAVSTNTSAIKAIMNNDRFAIKNGNTEAFYVGYDENLKKSVSRMNDLTITDYFTAGYHRQEKFEINGEQRTGWFYVGGE